ncbi:MAG: phosphoribosylglycinamide formyltransferase [Alcaligenaceae bacterium]
MSEPQILPCRFVILISGQGSNMRALVQACQSKACPGEVVAVVSNRPQAAGLQWAQGQGIATEVVAHNDFSSREAFDQALAAVIDRYAPDYVLLAGFMRILTPAFVERYTARLVNIHPSLLPAFPGMHTHEQALATGVQSHGCTVHFVTPVLDHGPIIAQGVVPVLAEDTPDTLASRVLTVEHRVYPAVATWLAQSRVKLMPDQRVQVEGISRRLFVSEQAQ